MTIVAGFRCNDGIVMCADTQESMGYLKRDEPKLVVKGNLSKAGGPKAIFAGAGDSDFIDHLVEHLWDKMRRKKSIESIVKAAEDELANQYRQFVPIYPSGMPDADFLVAIWYPPSPSYGELLRIRGPLVKRHLHADAIGAGWIIAAYINHRLVKMKTRLADAVPIAIYMIDQAKKYVEGCGGQTNVVTLAEDGTITQYDQEEVDKVSKDFSQMDDLARQIVRFVMDGALEDEEYNKIVDSCLRDLEKLRKGFKT